MRHDARTAVLYWLAIPVMTVSLVGCQTFGVSNPFGDDPERQREQAALEGAALAAVFHYARLPDEMSTSEKLQSTLDTANDFVATMYPQFGSFPALLQKRIKDVTSDKFNPQVATIYYLLKEILAISEE